MSISRLQAGGILGLTLAVIVLDQWVKGLVVGALALNESHPLVHGVLDLSYRRNTGVAFSAMPQSSPYLLVALNLVVLGLFVALMLPHLHKLSGRIAIALVCGGAVGNIIDRLRLHYVIDYVDLHFWPVFNIADAGIVIGVGILLLALVFSRPSPAPAAGDKSS